MCVCVTINTKMVPNAQANFEQTLEKSQSLISSHTEIKNFLFKMAA